MAFTSSSSMLSNLSSSVRRIWQRRPILSSVTAIVTGGTCFATYVEYQTWQLTQKYAAQQLLEDNSSNNESKVLLEYDHPWKLLQHRAQLPREYNGAAIRTYWTYRPLTTWYRVCEITMHLVPRAYDYIRDFYMEPQIQQLVQQRVSSSTSLASTDSKGGENEDSRRTSRTTELQRQHAVAWRGTLTALGPAFVKVGQQLSIRPDLVPQVVLQELQTLCDAVQPVSDEIALAMIRKELNVDSLQEIFCEEPVLVAAASLGQVYKARLIENNQQVAVKVQRPNMLATFSLDLFLLQQIGWALDIFTSTFTNQPPFHQALYDSFVQGSYSELDYEKEAENQTLFRNELAKRKCPVVIPAVYGKPYSTRTVLTTEWIDGIRLADAPVEQIRQLIPIGVELFLTQLLDIGHFHADPHVGNLLVVPNGQLCLLDFGLCATISEQDRYAMTKAILHLLQRDFASLVHSDSKALGFLPESFDTTDLLPLLTKILTVGLFENESSDGNGMSMRRHRHRKLQEISNELNEIFFTYPFSVPPFFALVTRGLGLLEGIALTGDADFDIFQAAVPYARRRAIQILGREVLMQNRRPTRMTVPSK